MDGLFRGVYNPVSIVNLQFMAFVCRTRVIAGGLADDGRPISFGTPSAEACAVPQEAVRSGGDPGRSLFRYRGAGWGLLPHRLHRDGELRKPSGDGRVLR